MADKISLKNITKRFILNIDTLDKYNDFITNTSQHNKINIIIFECRELNEINIRGTQSILTQLETIIINSFCTNLKYIYIDGLIILKTIRLRVDIELLNVTNITTLTNCICKGISNLHLENLVINSELNLSGILRYGTLNIINCSIPNISLAKLQQINTIYLNNVLLIKTLDLSTCIDLHHLNIELCINLNEINLINTRLETLLIDNCQFRQLLLQKLIYLKNITISNCEYLSVLQLLDNYKLEKLCIYNSNNITVIEITPYAKIRYLLKKTTRLNVSEVHKDLIMEYYRKQIKEHYSKQIIHKYSTKLKNSSKLLEGGKTKKKRTKYQK